MHSEASPSRTALFSGNEAKHKDKPLYQIVISSHIEKSVSKWNIVVIIDLSTCLHYSLSNT